MSASKKQDMKSSNPAIAKYSSHNLFDIDNETESKPVKYWAQNNSKKTTVPDEQKKLGPKTVDPKTVDPKTVDPKSKNPYFDEQFKPIRDTLKLEEAIKEKNKTNILDLFCKKSRQQRVELSTLYKNTYGKDYTKDISNLYKKSTVRIFDIISSDLLIAYAHSFKEAFEEKNYLYALLLTRICAKADLKEIAEIYKGLFKKPFEKEFDSFSKGIKELCLYYYDFEFENMLTDSDIDAEVENLVMNIKSKDTFFLVIFFSRRQPDFILKVCNTFYQRSEKTIMECFKDKMSTQSYECFSLLYDLVHNVPSTIGNFISKQLDSPIDLMLDLIILRSETDLGNIVQEYFRQKACQLLESFEMAFKDERKIIAQYFLNPFSQQ